MNTINPLDAFSFAGFNTQAPKKNQQQQQGFGSQDPGLFAFPNVQPNYVTAAPTPLLRQGVGKKKPSLAEEIAANNNMLSQHAAFMGGAASRRANSLIE